EAVLLRDVQVLTLYRGRYTTARRSSPVPQLQCVGGSAGCTAFVPEVVQCQNKGWDGVDIQWECKADMDNWYRFGKVEVSCEGYNNPGDSYILRGSCGLEYALELTAEGRQNRGGSPFSGSWFSKEKQKQGSGEGLGDLNSLVIVGAILLLGFAVYKLFLCDLNRGSNGDGFRGNQGPGGATNGNMGPPPPGFKSEYTDPPPAYDYSDSYSDPRAAGCGGGGFGGVGGGLGGLGGGLGGLGGGLGGLGGGVGGRNRGGNGFWSGMGTGGLLGYLFGSQRRVPHVSPFTPPHYNSSSGSSSNSSSGSRTASGFGGTKRR
ncbi:store-operated calcium entry-associated regulatory factor isoform X1, partial [Silurus asotus]